MKLKTWIIVFLVFAVACVAGDFALTQVAVYRTTSGDAGRIHRLYGENGDEIPIFGSSQAYYDYDPEEMGSNVFNYGLAGTSYEVTDVLLQIELAKHKTSPIIIDLKPESEHTIGDPSNYIPFVFDPRLRRMLERTDSMEWRYYVPGIRYFGYYDFYAKDFLNDRFHVMRTVVRGFSNEKFWSFDRARLDNGIEQRLLGTNGYFPDEDQNRRLEASIKQHSERMFFLVYSPVHPSCQINFKNLDQFNAFKARMGALPNAVVLDYSKSDYPDTWFKDTHHLLYVGAVDFSRKLWAKISEILQARSVAGQAHQTRTPAK